MKPTKGIPHPEMGKGSPPYNALIGTRRVEAKFKDNKEYFCEDWYLTDQRIVKRDQKEIFMRLNSEERTGPTIFKKLGEHKISPGSATFVSIASDIAMPIPEWLIRCANKLWTLRRRRT